MVPASNRESRILKLLGPIVLLFLVQSFISPESFAAKRQKKTKTPDTHIARRQVTYLLDVDETTLTNMGYYEAYLYKGPVIPGINTYSSLPSVVRIPSADYDRMRNGLRDQLGTLEGHRFHPKSVVGEVLLSDGTIFHSPGLYYTTPESLKQFHTNGSTQDSFVYNEILEKMNKGQRFLDAGAVFFAQGISGEDPDLNVGFLTMREDSNGVKAGMNAVREELSLGNSDFWVFGLTNDSMARFQSKKGVFTHKTFLELTNHVITPNAEGVIENPNYLVVFENDAYHLAQLDKKFTALASSGVGANPTIPVLVNVMDQEDFNLYPGGISLSDSPLRTYPKAFRVTAYYPENKKVTYNRLSGVFEEVYKMSPEAAEALYQKHLKTLDPYACTKAFGGYLGNGEQ